MRVILSFFSKSILGWGLSTEAPQAKNLAGRKKKKTSLPWHHVSNNHMLLRAHTMISRLIPSHILIALILLIAFFRGGGGVPKGLIVQFFSEKSRGVWGGG